jgi:ATP-dependent helicase YprA (DUF1998 family)
MSAINPLTTAEGVTATYGRYLKSLIKPRRPEIADALAACIDESISAENGIVKGPFLEATPPYQTGKSISMLVAEGVISPEFLLLGSASLPVDRPLYAHQESAIRKVAAGRNILVATGTGSGKTESFLLPILNNLMLEKEAGRLGPGVRALLLYPMNALANDQVKRIRELLENYPGITFGRYTGETPETEKIAKDLFYLAEGKANPPNELISRETIRETPPNILLTNYAMLEYLLLRPDDVSLFESHGGSSWKFIVADEAHTYDGAHGIEVATLLRKLRERVDPNHQVQTIGTTATIGGTGTDVKKFAENFFSNAFHITDAEEPDEDLVRPLRKEIETGLWGGLSPHDWLDIGDAHDFSRKFGEKGDSVAVAFRTERRVSALRRALFEYPLSIHQCAEAVFGETTEKALLAISRIVELGAEIKDSAGNQALSARFHLFARSTEGIFGCMATQPHFYLNRRVECEKCKNLALEMAGCNKCGATFFIGHQAEMGNEQFFKPEGSDESRVFLMPEDLEISDENEDDDLQNGYAAAIENQVIGAVSVCVKCGRYSQDAFMVCASCACKDVIRVKTQTSRNKCGACGSIGFPAIRKLESGNDAAASVLATEIYQHMPPSSEGIENSLSGEGRKLMVFSDNRQQAAYFAPYLEDRYTKILWRKVIYQSLIKLGQAHPSEKSFHLQDMLPYIVELAAASNLFDVGATAITKQVIAKQRLHFEITNTELQNNLEGIGLIKVEPEIQASPESFEAFLDFGLDDVSAKDLLLELLTTVRLGGIVSADSGVALDVDLFKPRTGPLYIRETIPLLNKRISSWLPKVSSNTRSNFAEKVLAKSLPGANAGELLSGIWSALLHADGSFPNVLETRSVGPLGVLSQLNHKKIKISALDQTSPIYECNKCGRVSPRSVFGVCPRYKCQGALEVATDKILSKGIFYSTQYQTPDVISLTAREHTAQLTVSEARDIQNDFVKGKVNVLSSSTTFELGVDVGELQSVFLRNVPPSVANYLQRAGRAGRRADSAALILTYAQRKPHDMSKYSDPVSMVAGKMRAPFVELENERIFQRHVYSIFFASYFRTAFIDSKFRAGIFFLEGGDETHSHRIVDWVDDRSAWLRNRFDAVLPKVLTPRADEIWENTVRDFKKLVAQVRERLAQEVADYESLIAEAIAKGTSKALHEAGRLSKVRDTIVEKDMISFLSKSNLIPKYGFPVDTVSLVPRYQEANAEKVDLDRDLTMAIFEYAPGSSVVAAGFIWESVGLGYVPSKEFARRQYAKCGNCDHYNEKISSDLDKLTYCEACATSLHNPHEYIVPEWGFVASSEGKRPGDSPRFQGKTNRSLYLSSEGNLVEIQGQIRPHGRIKSELRTIADLVLVNSGPNGQGYLVCPNCRAAFPGTQNSIANHTFPSNPDKVCGRNIGQRVHLGHKYQSDIVRVDIDLSGSDIQATKVAKAFGYALLQGAANGLQIADDDIDVIILPSVGNLVRLALVDAVPAGAGFAKLIAENMGRVFESALSRVKSCECGLETSCYECLRTYRNQKDHDSISRHDAVTALTFALGLERESCTSS